MTFYAKVLLVLLSLPVHREDVSRPEEKRAQLQQVARAIVDAVAPDGPDGENQKSRVEAALLISTGDLETRFGLRVAAGHCRRHECDGGLARGPWQVHRNGMSEESWEQQRGLENLPAQARTAAKHFAWGRAFCRSTRGAIARYLGLRCRSENPQVEQRFRHYLDALRKLEVLKES